MPGTASNPLSPGASPAAPPSRGEIERKLSMRSAEPPRPRRRSSNPGPPSVVQSGNESDSSFQSSLAGPGPITATSPITGSPSHNTLSAAGNTTNTIPNTHNPNNVNQFPNANPGTTTVGSVGGSNLSIPPKGGSSVLSSIQERGERPDPSSRPYGSAIGGSDYNYNYNHNHNTEYDYYDLEEVEEDEDLGETELELDPEDDDDPENVPGGRTKVDGEELKRGMEGERVIKSGYLMKKGEKRKNWKKRWFVLRTEKLAYYRDEKEYMLCQILSLRDIHSVVTVQLKKHNYAFGIVTAKRTFYVRATSQGEMEGWVHSVNDARRNLAEGDEKARSPPNVGSNAGQGSANINIPVPAGSTSISHMPNRGTGVGMSESSGLYGVSPGYTEMSLGSYTPQRGGSISHSLGGAAYGSQPQTPSGLYQAQMQVQQPGIESQLDRLAVIDHAATPTASDRSRGIPDTRTTSAHRDPSTSSVSSLPVEPGTTPFGNTAGYTNNNSQHHALAPAFVPTSSDEEDDAFVPRSLGQSSHIAGMMSMSPTTQLSPMGHPPFPAGPSTSHPVPVQTDPKKVILNGYLMKLGTRGKKTWRKRWFVLTSGELVYTKSHMDTKVHRQIPLSSILDAIEFEPVEPLGSDDTDSDSALDQARSPTSPRKPRHLHRERHHTGSKSRREEAAVRHAFQVITPQRTFRLSAPSEEEEIKWVAALRALINRERGLMSPTMATGTGMGGLAPALPNVLSPASGYGQAGQGMGTGVRGYSSQAATPNVQGGGGEEGSYFGLSPVLGNHSHTPSVPATPIGGFSYPVHQTQMQMGSTTPTSSSQQGQMQGQVQGQQARSPASRSSLPPLITTPSHARTRSATQSAKAAVAEVVRRFNPESSAG